MLLVVSFWIAFTIQIAQIARTDLETNTAKPCKICFRIALLEQCTKKIDRYFWPDFGSTTLKIPLFYYTSESTYIAFLDKKTDQFGTLENHSCTDSLILKKMQKRYDQRPFHMENKISLGNQSSVFYRNPVMMCSDVESMTRFIPVFTSTEEWLQLVLHEYFHSFQFKQDAVFEYLASTIQSNSDSLRIIYETNDDFRKKINSENKLLKLAIQTTDPDSQLNYIRQFIHDRENRRNQYSRELNRLIIQENFWETIEGTARYIEAYLPEKFNQISFDSESAAADSLFNNFAHYQSQTDIELSDTFIKRTEAGNSYFYATGFNLCRLLDKLKIDYKSIVFNNPEKSLYHLLCESLNKH